jgi:hypothetical protein
MLVAIDWSGRLDDRGRTTWMGKEAAWAPVLTQHAADRLDPEPGLMTARHEFGKGGVVDPAAVPGSHPGIS